MNLKHHVERYVGFMRQLGYKYVGQDRMLRSYADYAEAHGDTLARTDRMVDWASKAPSYGSVRNRLGAVRSFAIWLRAEDERHEVPPLGAIGGSRRIRPSPHLLTPDQIERLMDAARSVGPAGSITPHTYRCMIGLIAATGLRVSEAIALRLSDFTSDGLIVRNTKFRKSRLIVLHPSARDALHRYLKVRMRERAANDHLFLLPTGHPPTRAALIGVFTRLARRIGLRGGPGEPGPRLHDLRHSFAVRSLEQAVATDRGSVNRHILALGTYLGHVKVSSTYWYLEATPSLLRQISEAAENAQTRRVSP